MNEKLEKAANTLKAYLYLKVESFEVFYTHSIDDLLGMTLNGVSRRCRYEGLQGDYCSLEAFLYFSYQKTERRRTMAAYVIFDVDIRDANRYQDFMKQVKPALEKAGGAISLVAGRTKSMRAIGIRAESCSLNFLPSRHGSLSTTALCIKGSRPFEASAVPAVS